jgi:hypothetical protein
MRIGIIGGGPAGLYFALLMKARDARHEVRVVEQNPRDATYGWGLVFAAPTLRFLADSDPEVYADLRKDWAELDTIEIGHRGARVAVTGQSVGAGVAHRHAPHAAAPLPGARGGDRVPDARREPRRLRGLRPDRRRRRVASTIRAKRADWFQPSVEHYRNKSRGTAPPP